MGVAQSRAVVLSIPCLSSLTDFLTYDSQLSESEKEMEASAKSARGFKSAARKLLEQGVNPRAAAKLAARMRGGEAAGGKKKVRSWDSNASVRASLM